jgi:hypothetical protein
MKMVVSAGTKLKQCGRWLLAPALLAVAALLSACGDPAPGGGSGGGGGPTSSGMTLTLTDSATGTPRNTLTLASPLTATARVVDGSGRPVANTLVQFSVASADGSGPPVAVLSPASGNGITNSEGRFSVSLLAADLSAQGAGTISAFAPNETSAPSATASFQVGATNISLQNVTRSPAQINPLQTSTITVSVSGVAPTVPVSVGFASACAANGLATLPASVVTANGVATAVYSDKGCSGTDNITISAAGAASVQTTIEILPAPPTAIQFVSAAPDVISVAGSGGPSASLVTFRVVNSAQQAVGGLSVTLSLATEVGGVTLDNQSGSIVKQSAADGTVAVTVGAGTQPGPVRVRAEAAGLSTLSSLLTIQTGLPTQNRVSLSVETFNIEGLNVDGVTTAITIRAADRTGNPVPDGTTFNFRSSGALIQPSCRITAGACSVNFVSQNNRPPSGRVAILAWAVGEESFQDLNGNNRYDAGEPWGDLGDAFVDVTLDGAFQPGEEFIEYNPAATQPCTPNSLSAPGRPNSCDGLWGLAHVRASGQVVLSGSTPVVTLPASITLTGGGNFCSGSLNFNLADANGNPMPAGTTVAATLTPATGLAATVFGSPVVNTLTATLASVDISATLAGTATCDGSRTSLLRVTVTTPLGLATTLPAVTVRY